MLDHIIAKPVREDLPRQRWDRDARGFPLQDVAEILKVGISTAHTAVSELERRDVGAAEDLVIGVHVAAHAVGSWVLDLYL